MAQWPSGAADRGRSVGAASPARLSAAHWLLTATATGGTGSRRRWLRRRGYGEGRRGRGRGTGQPQLLAHAQQIVVQAVDAHDRTDGHIAVLGQTRQRVTPLDDVDDSSRVVVRRHSVLGVAVAVGDGVVVIVGVADGAGGRRRSGTMSLVTNDLAVLTALPDGFARPSLHRISGQVGHRHRQAIGRAIVRFAKRTQGNFVVAVQKVDGECRALQPEWWARTSRN